MQSKGVELEMRDLSAEPLSVAELDRIIGKRDATEFLNPKNEIYRKKGFARKPPTRKQALKLMVSEPNLIRRPIVISGKQIVVGFDEQKINALLERQSPALAAAE